MDKRLILVDLTSRKIEDEFLKLKGNTKHSGIQSLKSKVERKLKRMLENNPLRIDFYERYQEIIDALQ